ncbi:MAG: NRDE family protein [Aestuariibacter sp.]
MCILFIAVNKHPKYPLIIAANRDEFYQRATEPSYFWSTQPKLLAGLDLEAGGTWMGINEHGFISAITNIRAPHMQKQDAISRGFLARDYLLDTPELKQFEQQLHQSRERYNGYNLLYGPWQNLRVYNNFDDSVALLSDGFYGLSNANLNSPWPKINKGVQALQSYCLTHDTLNDDALFDLLRDENKAEDHLLPQTGVPYEWEKHLSSIFIQMDGYGTRSSTLLTINHDNEVSWQERCFDNKGVLFSEQKFHFQIANK